jgi:hypothetical protein
VLQALLDVGIDGWRSRYASVKWYGAILNAFCKYVGKDPGQLVSLPKSELEEIIHSYLDSGLAKGLSKKTVKNRRSCLLMHFNKNGYRGDKELEIEVYPVPARYRKMLEYIPTSAEILARRPARASIYTTTRVRIQGTRTRGKVRPVGCTPNVTCLRCLL